MDTLASVVNKEIKSALIKNLGIALATLVILQNGKECEVMVANIDKGGYIKLIDAIVIDKRVMRAFDKKQIKAMKTKWLQQAE